MEKMLQQPNHEYVQALEMERTKMLVFERELPLSIELVSRAIESFRQQIDGGVERTHQHLCDSSEETTSDDCEPFLEFIPIKKPSAYLPSSESEDHPQDSENFSRKSDWLRSVQLWNNQTTDTPPKKEPIASMNEPGDAKKQCKSLNKQKSAENSDGHHSTESSSTETKEELVQYGKKGDNKDAAGSSERKPRRCWSQELHRRFLHSLHQLGGAHVATPKQIRELMKVDGLTNDEVKSHLQKYRLHTRRPTTPLPPNQSNGSSAGAPQFLFVGGIWVSPQDYSTIPLNGRASGFPTAGVYTPMAASSAQAQAHPLQQFNQMPQIKSTKISEGHGDALARCISPSLSSTTRTTPSHVY